jgi:hypothetical protein
LIAGKQLTLVPPVSIDRCFVFGSIEMKRSLLPLSGALEREKLRLLRQRIEPFKAVELFSAAFYFMALPALTLERGLAFSLLVFAPIQVLILLLTWMSLLRFRPIQGMRRPCKWCLALEIIVVPGLIPALSKRISLSYRMSRDAPHIVFSKVEESRRRTLRDIIIFRVDELVKNGEASEHEASIYLEGLEATG